MVYGTYVASQSIMFERSCLLPNIEALQTNSPVPACEFVIAEENKKQPHPILHMFLFTKIVCKKGIINAYLQIVQLDFSPQ